MRRSPAFALGRGPVQTGHRGAARGQAPRCRAARPRMSKVGARRITGSGSHRLRGKRRRVAHCERLGAGRVDNSRFASCSAPHRTAVIPEWTSRCPAKRRRCVRCADARHARCSLARAGPRAAAGPAHLGYACAGIGARPGRLQGAPTSHRRDHFGRDQRRARRRRQQALPRRRQDVRRCCWHDLVLLEKPAWASELATCPMPRPAPVSRCLWLCRLCATTHARCTGTTDSARFVLATPASVKSELRADLKSATEDAEAMRKKAKVRWPRSESR